MRIPLTEDQREALELLVARAREADIEGRLGTIFAQVFPVSGYMSVAFIDHERSTKILEALEMNPGTTSGEEDQP